MMRLVLALVCAFTLALQSQAQGGDGGRRRFSHEEYRQQLEACLMREAGITAEEGKELFPMVHEMNHELRRLSGQERELLRSINESTTEDEYETILNKATCLAVENKKTEQKFYKKFHSVISWKKVVMVRKALFHFNMQALKNFTPRPRPDQNQNQRRK